MVTSTDHTDSPLTEVCERIRELGFVTSAHIRIYGQSFEVVSDPFPDGDGVAIRVKTKAGKVRTLPVPVTVLQAARRARKPGKAA